jgi:hypothetical protein
LKWVQLPYEPQIIEWCNGSISEFESDDDSSNLSSITNVGFSLSGKVPHCECGEQGSSPEVNQGNNEQGTGNVEQGSKESELEK